jgi:hypothetical protein
MPAARSSSSQTKPTALIATQHFVIDGADGRPVFFHAGQRVRPDHPAVKGREELFKEPDED